jgi:hypothetical protein
VLLFEGRRNPLAGRIVCYSSLDLRRPPLTSAAVFFSVTGKKMDKPVRKLVMNVPLERAASTDAMAGTASLNRFVEFAARGKAKHDAV